MIPLGKTIQRGAMVVHRLQPQSETENTTARPKALAATSDTHEGEAILLDEGCSHEHVEPAKDVLMVSLLEVVNRAVFQTSRGARCAEITPWPTPDITTTCHTSSQQRRWPNAFASR